MDGHLISVFVLFIYIYPKQRLASEESASSLHIIPLPSSYAFVAAVTDEYPVVNIEGCMRMRLRLRMRFCFSCYHLPLPGPSVLLRL